MPVTRQNTIDGSRGCRALAALMVVIILTAASSSGYAQGSTTRYVYDDNGRLRAVIAPNGEANIYEYDAAGNITAIRRNTASTLEVLGFSPKEGVPGTQVTIIGTGFGGGVNAVAFNGTAAQIVSVNAPLVVVTAPNGVTTGPITVTTPQGTATTAQPFVVLCLPPPAGLVGWWPGDGNANDIVGSNHGTLQNGATFGAGKVGQAFRFDGANDIVQVPDAPSLNFSPTSPITVDLWAYRISGNPVMHIVGKRPGCAGGLFNYQMALNMASGQGLQFGSGFGPGNEVATGMNLPLNTWTHLAATFDGTTYRFYINGALVASAAGTLGPINSAPLVIGGSGGCSTFGGLIDEVEIFNRALTAAEIQAIYVADSDGKCKSTAANVMNDSNAAIGMIAAPTLKIAPVAGVAAPTTPGPFRKPGGSGVPSSQTNPVTVTLQAANIPLGTVVQVTFTPEAGASTSVQSTPLVGTVAASTAIAKVNLPAARISTIKATVSYDIPATNQPTGHLPMDGERVKRIEVAASYGGGSEVIYITDSGKRIKRMSE